MPRFAFASPGAAAVDELTRVLAERETKRRQDFLDSLALKRENRNDEIQRLNADSLKANRQAIDEERSQRMATGVAGLLRPGQVVDDATADTLKQGNLGILVQRSKGQEPEAALNMPKVTADIQGELSPEQMAQMDSALTGSVKDIASRPTKAGVAPGIQQFAGTPEQVHTQKQQEALKAFMDDPNTPAAVKQALQYEMSTGRNAPAGMFDKPEHQKTATIQEYEYYVEQAKKAGEVPKDLITFEKMKHEAAAGGNDGAVDLSPAGLEIAAKRYLADGTLPSMGMGKASAGVRTRIINRAAAIDPEAAIAVNAAHFTADKASLTQLQKQMDAVGSFERTALKNLDVFIKTAGQVYDTGSPFLNTPLRMLASAATGSPELSAYNTARRTVIPEFAKILNNPTMAGALSDSARHEIEEIVQGNATLAQIRAASDILKQDTSNRREAMSEQKAEIEDRMKAYGKPKDAPTSDNSPASTTTPTVVKVVWGRDANGKPVKVKAK